MKIGTIDSALVLKEGLYPNAEGENVLGKSISKMIKEINNK